MKSQLFPLQMSRKVADLLAVQPLRPRMSSDADGSATSLPVASYKDPVWSWKCVQRTLF